MTTGYTLAWIVYLVGALALLVTAWRVTRGFRREWRHLLLESAAALLLTPGPMLVDDAVFLAPALFVLVLDGLFDTLDSASRSGLIMLGVWLVALVISLIFQLLVRPRPAQPEAD
ncbi:hypothetical protein [Marinimicrobium sp. UBA4209]|jgi:hypothetical protein|uniref:hypothetical protein n=1 Tax=Marinimicrobium sp. UBA4209 TaxID=1946810 RepID=UPI00257D8E79|nr:hypothetical protein [Marinimicrobium sp. UBA4209]